MANRILRNLGFLLIWGDLYRVLFGIHAALVGSENLGVHLKNHLSLFLWYMDGIAGVHPITASLVEMMYGLPAAPAYFLTFALSTTVGFILVRRTAKNG